MLYTPLVATSQCRPHCYMALYPVDLYVCKGYPVFFSKQPAVNSDTPNLEPLCRAREHSGRTYVHALISEVPRGGEML